MVEEGEDEICTVRGMDFENKIYSRGAEFIKNCRQQLQNGVMGTGEGILQKMDL